MDFAYHNGAFLPKDEIKISPDDRGFLFADGIYEVVRWYAGFFYDMEGHVSRMKRSLRELDIKWNEADSFPSVATELIERNELKDKDALVYLQVTRGAAPRTHHFPSPSVAPTTYAFAGSFEPDTSMAEKGITVLLKNEIRWSRCDIKSIALLPNTLSFQEATEQGAKECIFIRDGLITEGSHSNIFFVIGETIYTHPESEHILSGITRKNVLRIARKAGFKVQEVAVSVDRLGDITEAFLANTGAEVTPIVQMGPQTVGKGIPGPVTKRLSELFRQEIIELHLK